MQVSSVLSGDLPLGNDSYGPGTAVTICFSQEELERLLAAYEPNSGTSPTIGDARPVLRAILNAVLERQS
jgi:hypothetical protein